MKITSNTACAAIVHLVATSLPLAGQPVMPATPPDSGCSDCYLYIDYCGTRYNRALGSHEMVVTVVRITPGMLKKMPRIKQPERYSPRTSKVILKQQQFLRPYSNQREVMPVNREKLKAFYPGGLKRGMIIDSEEYRRWNFFESPVVPSTPEAPKPKQWQYNPMWIDWFRTDPMNIRYRLRQAA